MGSHRCAGVAFVLSLTIGLAGTASATTYEIDVRLQTAKFYQAIDFTISEGSAPGDFVGEASTTACVKNVAFSGLGAWNHDASTSNLRAAFANTTAFQGPYVLMTCDFEGTSAPTAGQFTINVTNFSAVNHSTSPIVNISAIRVK